MVRRAGRDERIALIGACLFAATPMAAETVAYVASRSTALVSLFVLASLNVAARSLTEPRPRRLALAVALFLLAIASKEEAASLPLYLLLLDYFSSPRAASGTSSAAGVFTPYFSLSPSRAWSQDGP